MTLPYTTTDTRPTQIGLVVLQADETLERDMRQMISPEAEILVSRVRSAPDVTRDTLKQMESVLTDAASLLPRGATCAAVGYGCTSGTAEIGVHNIATHVQNGVTTPHVTEPVSALIAACRHLGVSRIGMLSPYVASVSSRLREVLCDAGITVAVFDSFDEAIEEKVVRISPSSIIAAAIEIGQDDACDALFLSCTNLRTLSVIDDLEARLSKPVLSSNQVLGWHLSQLSGAGLTQNAPGRLCK